MTNFEQQVLEDLAGLKVQMHQLMGVGQPGRLHQIEERVDCHERSMQRLQGFSGAFGGVLALVQFAMLFLRSRH